MKILAVLTLIAAVIALFLSLPQYEVARRSLSENSEEVQLNPLTPVPQVDIFSEELVPSNKIIVTPISYNNVKNNISSSVLNSSSKFGFIELQKIILSSETFSLLGDESINELVRESNFYESGVISRDLILNSLETRNSGFLLTAEINELSVHTSGKKFDQDSKKINTRTLTLGVTLKILNIVSDKVEFIYPDSGNKQELIFDGESIQQKDIKMINLILKEIIEKAEQPIINKLVSITNLDQ